MKFQCNTKPLQDALSLGVVSGNISKYYAKSVIAQITASKKELRINLEASYVLSEIILPGVGDEDEEHYALVDNMLFKNLISTLDENVTTIEFDEGGIIVHSGKSSFTIPNIVDSSDILLNRPASVSTVDEFSVCKDDWKFVKDSQMYAIAMSFVKPVYTKVWVGADGKVIVGDMSESRFTQSTKSNLKKTCLLSDTIINLLESLPEDSKMVEYENSYIVNVETDGYKFISQFTPQYEDDETIGSYNSDIIMTMLTVPEDKNVWGEIDTVAVSKLLSQADMLSSDSKDSLLLTVKDGLLNMKNSVVEGDIMVKGGCPEFSLLFNIGMLKDVVNHYDCDSVYIYPAINKNNEVVGILVWSDDMVTVLAGATS